MTISEMPRWRSPHNSYVADLLDDTRRSVSDDASGPHRVLAAKSVQIGPADGRKRDANDCFTGDWVWTSHLLDPDVLTP